MASLRIGGACGFWGEAPDATASLLAAGVDVLIHDYLAEVTLSILARARDAHPAKGYAADFVTEVLAPNLAEIAARGVKVVSNAGGMNPEGCARALQALIDRNGLKLRVGVVTGDDLSGFPGLADLQVIDPGASLPARDRIASANAYLGAFPIARALDMGADIVITGRCVDSALVLGPAIHAFGWTADDLDKLAQASLAGHLIECGPQATGGNSTDWDGMGAPDLIGYPIAEIDDAGGVAMTKPAGSGGTVSPFSVAEQMLYEIGDPAAYVLPDVVCDFRDVTLVQEGPDRVRVAGARGYPPPQTLKVSVTHADGWRVFQMLAFYGADAAGAARSLADAALRRARTRLAARGLPAFRATDIEVIGAGDLWGEALPAREVVLKLAAHHDDPKGAALLPREAVGLALAAPPGLCGLGGGLARPSPMLRLVSALVPKRAVPVQARVGDRAEDVSWAIVRDIPRREPSLARTAPPSPATAGTVPVPLRRIAVARSGDKGDTANIGVIARDVGTLSYIWAALTPDAVAARFAHVLRGEVTRHYLPGTNAMNLVLSQALGGGGMASLRTDPQGKGFAQLILDMPVPLPPELAETL